MATLMESYKNRLALAESMHKKSHNGAGMSAQKKLMVATVLQNTSKFMNEAFDTSAPTQRAALGDFKRFCLNVSNVAMPNLILPEIMLVQPMTSIAGYVTYVRYVAGIDKGGVKSGQLFNSPYALGKMDIDRQRYTGAWISETHKLTAQEINSTAAKFTTKWAPVAEVRGAKIGATTLTIDTANTDLAKGIVAFEANAAAVEGAEVELLYSYDNVVVPQQAFGNNLPSLRAEMAHVDLHAHARRIAIYYSQIAAFQAKTDYGFDMAEQLAAQAQGELAYEIDAEGIQMLSDGAEEVADLSFDKYEKFQTANTNGTYISRSQYYEGFGEIVARAKKVIYNRTNKFAPNYMICGSDVITVLPYVKGWTPAPAANINGPYFAGTIDNVKVYVSPAMNEEEFVFGVNGSDLQSSAAVYAPYMMVVPTQLLGMPDGLNMQGFSTMYDMKLLSTYDVAGEDPREAETGKYSYLLAKGKLVKA